MTRNPLTILRKKKLPRSRRLKHIKKLRKKPRRKRSKLIRQKKWL